MIEGVDGMNGIQFLYFLGHLSVRIFLLFTIANALVCGNVLLLKLTFWLLQKKKTVATKPKRIDFPSPLLVDRGERPITTRPILSTASFINANTGKKERWIEKVIWIRDDH